jgi:hypothetical protein
MLVPAHKIAAKLWKAGSAVNRKEKWEYRKALLLQKALGPA